MANGKIKIDADVADVLRSARIDGCSLKITWQLERKLYERTNKVLAALGGKWKGGKTQAHLFPYPVADVLAQVLDAGVAVDEKKSLCQFFTPPEVAALMVEHADLDPGLRILEPSAGSGNLLRAVFDALQSKMDNVTAIEISPSMTESLRLGFPATTFRCADFLQCVDERGFDRIIMNPPFDGGLDIKHIQHAESLLAPGGRLVALCANGPRQREVFMDRADHWEELPAGSFKSEGTGVSVALLVLTKPGPAVQRAEAPADRPTVPTVMDVLGYDLIYPNPNQPRKDFNPAKLAELAQSIRESGLMEPLVVTRRGERYMIIAGERRWRASGMAGLSEVPVRIIEADDRKVAELALLENLQRQDLNILEEAKAYQGLLDMGLTQEEIALKMGISQPWRIQERLNLLNLETVFQEYTVKGILTPSQAQELSRLPKEKQGILFGKISAGQANSYNKLRSLANALLHAEEQTSFLPEPTPEERAVNSKYDRMIEGLCDFIGRSFDRDDLSVLSSILTPSAKANIKRIDSIIIHLNKIKRALLQADSTREVLEQSAMSA